MRLVLLTSLEELAAIERVGIEVGSDTLLTSGDLSVVEELEDRGLPVVDQWSLLDVSDLDASWSTSHELAAAWWKDLGDSISGDAAALDLLRNDLVYPFEVCLNAALISKRLFSQGRVHDVFLPDRAVVPILRNQPAPLFSATSSLTSAVLRWTGERHGAGIHAIPAGGSREKRIARPVPARRRVLPWAAAPDDARSALISDEWMSERETRALEVALSRTGWRSFRLSAFSRGAYHAARARTLGLTERLRGLVSAARSAYEGPHPELFANHHLAVQFDGAIAELTCALALAEFLGGILELLRPAVLIQGHEAFARERAITLEANRRGVTTVTIVHGNLSHAMDAKGLIGDSQIVVTAGKGDDERLTWVGVDPGRLIRAGSLAFERSRDAEVASLTSDHPRVAVLTASINSGHCGVVAEGEGHRKTWHNLLRLAARDPGRAYVHKPHPSYDHYDYYHYLDRSRPANFGFLGDVDLDRVLDGCDVAVLVNYCTGAALQAMLHGIPVLYLRSSVYPSLARSDPLAGRVPTAESVEDLELMIGSLSDPVRRREVLGTQAGLLDDFVGAGSVEAAASRVMTAIEGSSPSRSEGAGLRHLFLAEAFIAGASARTHRDLRAALRAQMSTASPEPASLRRVAVATAYWAFLQRSGGWRALRASVGGVALTRFGALHHPGFVREVGLILMTETAVGGALMRRIPGTRAS